MNKQRRGPDNTLMPQPSKPVPQPSLSEETGEGVMDTPKEEKQEKY